MSRFRFVEDHRDAYGAKRLCRVLGIERSSYRWRGGVETRAARAAADGQLAEEITGIHARHKGSEHMV